MKRTYAAKRLLEHGPLTFREFKEITGWPPKAVNAALDSCIKCGVAQRNISPGNRRYVYRLCK